MRRPRLPSRRPRIDVGTISFTPNLARHLPCPSQRVAGTTVRAALEAVFETNVALRSYVLDDQGRLRKHVNVYVNDEMVRDRDDLSDVVAPGDDLFVFQALSGG